MPDMTKQLVVIARSVATKQSNEIATNSSAKKPLRWHPHCHCWHGYRFRSI